MATPTSYDQCSVRNPPRGDVLQSELRAHWLSDRHDFGEEASVFVCVPDPEDGGEVKVHPPEGVTVTPLVSSIDPAGTGIVRLGVRASPGASGELVLYYTTRGGGGDVAGPKVETDDDGWSLLFDG